MSADISHRRSARSIRTAALIVALPCLAALAFGVFNGAAVSDLRPHHAPLAVCGPADLYRLLDADQPGTFDIRPYASATAAENAVRNRTVTAAITADTETLVAIAASGEDPRISQRVTAAALGMVRLLGGRLRQQTHTGRPSPAPS